MHIPCITPLRARQHLHTLLSHHRCLQTLPFRPPTQGRYVNNPQPCALSEDSSSHPISSTANNLTVSAPRTHPSILPTGLKYEFHTGSSFFAKRPSRPFPPPFNSTSPPDSTSLFRDAFRNFHFNNAYHRYSGDLERQVAAPLTPTEEDALGFLRGVTNGDDAVVYSPYYLGVADGVGAWNTRPQGHAALWSRLVLHFWALGTEQQILRYDNMTSPPPANDDSIRSPISALQASYESTIAVTTPLPLLGTTTACLATLLPPTTLLLTNVGDSQAFVFRPSEGKFIARTEEQWHWFDCPRQLGTNSPDTPVGVGKVVEVQIEDGDLVLLATDGLMDNLWETEVVRELVGCLEAGEGEGVMAEKLVEKAKSVAGDPWGLSPYMERAVEQGLGIEGGKWDDISVLVARCQKRS